MVPKPASTTGKAPASTASKAPAKSTEGAKSAKKTSSKPAAEPSAERKKRRKVYKDPRGPTSSTLLLGLHPRLSRWPRLSPVSPHRSECSRDFCPQEDRPSSTLLSLASPTTLSLACSYTTGFPGRPFPPSFPSAAMPPHRRLSEARPHRRCSLRLHLGLSLASIISPIPPHRSVCSPDPLPPKWPEPDLIDAASSDFHPRRNH